MVGFASEYQLPVLYAISGWYFHIDGAVKGGLCESLDEVNLLALKVLDQAKNHSETHSGPIYYRGICLPIIYPMLLFATVNV